MSRSDTDKVEKRRLSRDSGAEPPRKTLRASMSMPKEKNGLFVLHDGETAAADIVAVHGLCGDAFETWTEENSGKLWLRDFLPSQVPNTRIMSYGYESSVAFSKSETELGNFAADLLNRLNDERGTPGEKDRPVIFICHSLGGIVVKKALILAHDRSEAYRDLLGMVKGVVFMGTPHRGANVASWANFATRALQALQMSTTNTSFLSDLEGNSETLMQISQQFVERGSAIKMKTFYETVRLNYMTCLVVEKDSAILNLPTELPAAPMHADHRSMCKFASKDEQKYRPVWKAVEHFVETLCPVAIHTLSPILKTVDPGKLLRNLPAVDQEGYKSRTCPSSWDQPKFYWIFRNMDFDQWQRANGNGMEVLWLSGPAECRISDASSRIVDLAKETYPEVQHSVLYFFCSTAPTEIPFAVTFVSTVICQLVRCSPELKQEITTIFLHTLLDKALGEKPLSKPDVPHFSADDSAEVMVRKILKAPKDAYWGALRAVTDIEREKGLSFIIDGLDETEHQKHEFIRELCVFMEHLRKRPSTTTSRVLLTSRPQAEIKEILGRLRSIEYDKERKECLNSLRFDNTRYEKISEQHEGSLKWLWTHRDYIAWSSADSSDLLLIEGKPGSGKSTLMKYFQRSLLKREPRKLERQIVASFYYSYREGENQTKHSNMLRSVLYDILNQNEEFFFHFQSCYRQVTQGGHPEWSYKSLMAILLSLAKSHPVRERLYLIVDAMDESDRCERIDVIKFLHELCAARGPCIVKVFAASRPIVELRGHSAKDHKMIRLQDVNYADILKFTESFLGDLELDLEPGTSIARSAMEYITENARGVFVWVHLIREELLEYARDGCTEDEIFDFLKGLPTELEGIYQRILMRLEGGKERDLEVGQKMLQFVLFAYRPLGLDELKQALAIRDNLDSEFSLSDESFQRKLIHGIERRIISCAGNFLEIKARGDHGIVISRKQSNWGCLSNRSAEDSVVQVMHQTVREFFRSDGPTAQSKLRMNRSDTQMRIFITCIRYLMLCTAKTALIGQGAGGKPWTTEHFEAYAEYLSGRPFFNYALEYVEQHRQQCGQVAGGSELISQLHKKLNDDSPAAYMLGNWIPQTWGQRIPSHEEQDYGKNFRVALLHAATRMNYPRVVEALLIAGVEVEACLDGKTPLMVTAESGDLATARVLLDRGALIGAKNGNKQTALHLAAASGHSPVAGLLIDRGAYKEAKDYKKRTAVHLAATNGRDSVAGLLIDRGADKEAKDEKGQTPLHLAAASGHHPVAGLLIDRGAYKEAKDVKGQTPLHVAAASGHHPVAGLLIDRGADKEAKDEKGQTPLHLAAASGHHPVAGLLIDRGAYKEAKDYKKRTAVHLAATNGRDSVAGLLIDRGADKEAKDEKGQIPLHLAAASGHHPVAELLIDQGTNKEAEDREGQTALHLAAANGRNPIIRLLVDRGANKKAKDAFGWGLLHTAAWNDHEATIEMLVTSLDASKEERDNFGWTALHVAAMNGCDTASRCLIEHLGADREAKDKVGWTALHFVAALGLEETAQLLIQTFDVDRDARNKEGKTAKDVAQQL